MKNERVLDLKTLKEEIEKMRKMEENKNKVALERMDDYREGQNVKKAEENADKEFDIAKDMKLRGWLSILQTLMAAMIGALMGKLDLFQKSYMNIIMIFILVISILVINTFKNINIDRYNLKKK